MRSETLWSQITRGKDTSTFSHSARLRMRVGWGGGRDGGRAGASHSPTATEQLQATTSPLQWAAEPSRAFDAQGWASGRALGHGGQNPSRTLCDKEVWAGVSGWEGTPEGGYRPVNVFSGGGGGCCRV